LQEANDLAEALKNAAVMVSELRTGALTPKVSERRRGGRRGSSRTRRGPPLTPDTPPAPPLLSPPQVYYELYMDVFDGLGYLEVYFSQLAKGGTPLAELYHRVQSAGQVLVRLYLLITAGSVYVRSGQAPSKVVLRDLLDMAKGVQHPTRGLFLRYFLSQKMKDKLPDEGSQYEGAFQWQWRWARQ
jgi:hypothetical protein